MEKYNDMISEINSKYCDHFTQKYCKSCIYDNWRHVTRNCDIGCADHECESYIPGRYEGNIFADCIYDIELLLRIIQHSSIGVDSLNESLINFPLNKPKNKLDDSEEESSN